MVPSLVLNVSSLAGCRPWRADAGHVPPAAHRATADPGALHGGEAAGAEQRGGQPGPVSGGAGARCAVTSDEHINISILNMIILNIVKIVKEVLWNAN